MKRTLLILLCLCAFTSVMLTACKKRKAFKREDGQDSVDARFVQGENDAALKDINDVLNSQALLRGRSANSEETATTFCGFSADTSQAGSGVVILTYDHTMCNARTRSGRIVLTVLNYPFTKLKNQGCVVKINFEAYTVTRLYDGKSVELNGEETMTNESGGTFYELLYLNLPVLIHSVSGSDLAVNFNYSDKTTLFNIGRRYTYVYSTKTVQCTCIGLGSFNGKNNLENWGKTYEQKEFTSQVVSPVVWNSTCGPLAPVQGKVLIAIEDNGFDLACSYGVDPEGNGIVSGCPYGWRLDWAYKRKSKSRVFGY